jgi:hypothetical protein
VKLNTTNKKARSKANKESATLMIPITYLNAKWIGSIKTLPRNRTYELIIDYPLSIDAVYQIKTGKAGMSSFRLLKEIGKAYDDVYNNQEKYGVWGHSIDDLALEGIKINHNTKMITIYVGS